MAIALTAAISIFIGGVVMYDGAHPGRLLALLVLALAMLLVAFSYEAGRQS